MMGVLPMVAELTGVLLRPKVQRVAESSACSFRPSGDSLATSPKSLPPKSWGPLHPIRHRRPHQVASVHQTQHGLQHVPQHQTQDGACDESGQTDHLHHSQPHVQLAQAAQRRALQDLMQLAPCEGASSAQCV